MDVVAIVYRIEKSRCEKGFIQPIDKLTVTERQAMSDVATGLGMDRHWDV